MNNEIKIFEHEQFGKVRTILIDGQPWFVGTDVAKALGYTKPHNALERHIDEDDSLKRESSTTSVEHRIQSSLTKAAYTV